MLCDGLSDSDDDATELPAVGGATDSTQQRATKLRRLTASGNATASGVAQTSIAVGSSRLEQGVDQLIALQRNGTSTVAMDQLLARHDDVAANLQQFQPTGMQTSIYTGLINGKYASMSAQRFVEFVQIYWRKFGFFPHPAVLRALFGWDFGTRGLSILHFYRVTELEKRTRVRGNDMSNFSRKNTLPPPSTPGSFSAIIGAVEVLCAVAQQLYKPVVYETLTAASNFLGELRVSELPSTPEALTEIAAWIDDRLELFRLSIIEENWHGVGAIKPHFSASHDSFVRVHELILRQDVAAAAKVSRALASRSNHQA